MPDPTQGNDRPAGDPRAEAAEAVQQAARAMIQVAREVLDAMERIVDDPKVADGLMRTVGEWAAGVTAAAERIRRAAGPVPNHPDDRGDDPGIQHIEVG